ncbi:interactor of constitutive active ROPs 4-like protein [Tanacetum coccineum]
MKGRRVLERCGSMDKHYCGVFDGYGGRSVGSPGGMSDDLDDGLGSGKRKGSGMRMIGQQAQSSRWQLAVSASKSITRQYDDVLPWKAAEAVEGRNKMLKRPNFGLCFAFGNKLSNFVAAMPNLEPEVAPTGRLRSYFQFPVHVLITSNPQRPLKLITLAKTTLPPQYLTQQTSSSANPTPIPTQFDTMLQSLKPTEKKLIEKEDTQKKTTKPSARKALFARSIDFANQGTMIDYDIDVEVNEDDLFFQDARHIAKKAVDVTYMDERVSARLMQKEFISIVKPLDRDLILEEKMLLIQLQSVQERLRLFNNPTTAIEVPEEETLKTTTSPVQTATGKDLTNPLRADALLKSINKDNTGLSSSLSLNSKLVYSSPSTFGKSKMINLATNPLMQEPVFKPDYLKAAKKEEERYYVVFKGPRSGIYTTWGETQKICQEDKSTNKKFRTLEQAQMELRLYGEAKKTFLIKKNMKRGEARVTNLVISED